MQIYWHGYTSVRIEAKTGERECTLLTDPFENETSIRFPRTLTPDVVVLSHQDRKRFNLEPIQGTPFVISDPGEYEVKGLFVNGVQDPKAEEGLLRPVVYRFQAEGMTLAFLGGLKRALTEAELEALPNIDILLLPVGGGEGMDAKTAAHAISAIEPRIVVPLSYDIPGIKATLGSVDAFCKHLGACERLNANRLKIAKKDLPVDQIMVAVLERA
ncbi:MAG TPA: MBL fold metallo-hydrolase [Candidatus Methylomirabilis sp.]|nr:MBL fold metallo-hydrolase [Candidatus Methylomirabilis sp.]